MNDSTHTEQVERGPGIGSVPPAKPEQGRASSSQKSEEEHPWHDHGIAHRGDQTRPAHI